MMQQGAILNEHCMTIAAGSGHTALCENLQAKQCPMTAHACAAAAAAGHADTLRWLCEHGCPWMPNLTAQAAIGSSSVAVFQYLQQRGIVFSAAQLTAMLNCAGAKNKLTVAKWLRQQGAV
jgi:hypothetical protein